jgi:hypothetical protein
MVLETLVFSPLNQLTRLVAREYFIKVESDGNICPKRAAAERGPNVTKNNTKQRREEELQKQRRRGI